MLINDIFKNQKEEILKKIENLPVYNCINNFDKYLSQSPNDDFEYKYINLLCRNREDLAKKVISKYYSKLSKDELLEELIKANIDAPYSFESYFENNELTDFFSNHNHNDADAHELIKEYMLNQYNNLIAELELPAKEEKRNIIIKSIENIEKAIKDNKKELIDLRSKLVELDEEE